MLAEQKIPEHFGKPRFEDIPDRLEVAKALGHLFRVDLHEGVVHPVFGKLTVTACFRLGNFVFVVGEDKIHSAAVYVQGKVWFGHGRALDVPAGAPFSPRALPVRLSRLGCFPDGKVERIPLLFSGSDSCTGKHIIDIPV